MSDALRDAALAAVIEWRQACRGQSAALFSAMQRLDTALAAPPPEPASDAEMEAELRGAIGETNCAKAFGCGEAEAKARLDAAIAAVFRRRTGAGEAARVRELHHMLEEAIALVRRPMLGIPETGPWMQMRDEFLAKALAALGHAPGAGGGASDG